MSPLGTLAAPTSTASDKQALDNRHSGEGTVGLDVNARAPVADPDPSMENNKPTLFARTAEVESGSGSKIKKRGSGDENSDKETGGSTTSGDKVTGKSDDDSGTNSGHSSDTDDKHVGKDDNGDEGGLAISAAEQRAINEEAKEEYKEYQKRFTQQQKDVKDGLLEVYDVHDQDDI